MRNEEGTTMSADIKASPEQKTSGNTSSGPKRTQDRVQELRALFAQCDELISAEEMQQAYDRLAGEITDALSETLPVVLAVMNGGLFAAGQLLPRLTFPLEVSYIHASRYRGATTGGALKWMAQPDISLAGRDVLIIDDIFDEGHTLKGICDWCASAGANKVWVAVATDKLHDHKVEGLRPDFVGVPVPDRYIFGEGMDYDGFFRNMSGIYALPEG
jgi:hypoxanthine phosphoribosyltransferase